jgi:hypothetical protein
MVYPHLKSVEKLDIKLHPEAHQHGTYVMLRGCTYASYGGEQGIKSMRYVSVYYDL